MSSGERLFIDTAFAIGLLNANDQHHAESRSLHPRVRNAREVWTTEAVLTEIANILSKRYRSEAVQYIRALERASNSRIVSVDHGLFADSLVMYAQRADKSWGLTDCISFVVMQREGLTLAATTDRHFLQAGFTPLMTIP